MGTYPFRDRPLDARELEMLRLALSTFRDGSGQAIKSLGGKSMPNFRDYERSLAAVVDGSTRENKGIFDVIVDTDDRMPFGISCKMAVMPSPTANCSFMELSNAAAMFRNHLLNLQINWATEPTLAGPALIDLVTSWHRAVPAIDLPGSRYGVLAHDSSWVNFRVLCYRLDLAIKNPRGEVEWAVEGRSLNGYIDDAGRRHRLWQWYANSGGQLKYYPLLDWAEWVTEPFRLESPPIASPLDKAKRYFPDLWPD